jgi:hypothetical protein
MKKLIIIIFIHLLSLNSEAQYTNILIDDINYPTEPSIGINLLNINSMAAAGNSDNSYYSTDGGLTWITGIINSAPTSGGDPCLVTDLSGNFYYFHMTMGRDKIYCQKSSDGGLSYNNGSFAWNNNNLTQDKEWATFDPVSSNLYVTWTEYDNQAFDDSNRIFFAKSTDFGNSFSNAMRINSKAGTGDYPLLDPHPFTGPNGELYVTFTDSNGIRFNRSLDYGNTWLSVEPVIESNIPARYYGVIGSYKPSAMPYSSCDRSNSPYRGNLYVSWCDNRNGNSNSDVFIIKSTDGGNSWSSAMKVNSDTTSNHQYHNAMSVDQTNGYIYIVYYDRRNYVSNDSSDVYVSKSIDGGTSWTDIKVSSSGFFFDSNGLVFDGDYIDIAAHAGIVRPIWTRVDTIGGIVRTGIWTCIFNDQTSLIQTKPIAQSLSLNPNPVKDFMHISCDDGLISNIEIYDLRGWKLFEFKDVINPILNVSKLSSGVYFVAVSRNKTRTILKFIKQ